MGCSDDGNRHSVRRTVVTVTTAPRRRGPAPRFSRAQLVDAALAVVESQGFGALSLRSVARHLEVGPMTLYTYVDSSDELASLVVERLVEESVQGLRWPRSARGVLTLFAKELDALVVAHPAMVEAYQRGMVRTGRADQVAADVLGRLTAGGLSPARAREAYVAVHALVLGFALLRTGSETSAQSATLATVVDALLDGLEL